MESLVTAFQLIAGLDQDVLATVRTSLFTSGIAILLASVIGVPLGGLVGFRGFVGKRMVVTLLNTLMALPTVVIGLVVFGLLSRQGPLGSCGFLFTPAAMILGQMILAVPIVTNHSMVAVTGADVRILPTLQTLGLGPVQTFGQLLLEVRFGIMAAVITGFGRVIGEVGVAMMLGGNIRGYTRTMTTAIALETSKGEFAFGLALGIILMSVALLVNLALHQLQQR
jgi:tungstate transport system permease protein